MRRKFGLKDADIAKLALCKVGANRQRVFLVKADDEDDERHAAFAPLIKEPGKDWRVAYVPVAVPDSEEDQGIFGTGDGDVDVWESEDEIAKAAHSFMHNGQRIIGKHFDSAQQDGVRLVENAVALADFNVGETTIAKGTWYVGLEFTDPQLRQLVDNGEVDAVSVEGHATRVAKTETFSKPGTADVTPSDAKKIAPLARHYLGMPHPFTACVRDQIKHNLPEDHAKRRCAVLLDKFDPQRLRHSVAKSPGEWTQDDIDALVSQAESGTLGDVEQPPEGFWKRVAKSLGIQYDDDDGALAKESGTVEDVELSERMEQLEGRLNKLTEQLIGTEEEPGAVAAVAKAVDGLVEKIDSKSDDEKDKDKTTTKDEPESRDAIVKEFERVVDEKLLPLAERLEDVEDGDSKQVEGDKVAKSNGNGALAGILFGD